MGSVQSNVFFSIVYGFSSFKMPVCIAYGCANKSGTVKKSFFVVPKPINEEGKRK